MSSSQSEKPCIFSSVAQYSWLLVPGLASYQSWPAMQSGIFNGRYRRSQYPLQSVLLQLYNAGKDFFSPRVSALAVKLSREARWF